MVLFFCEQCIDVLMGHEDTLHGFQTAFVVPMALTLCYDLDLSSTLRSEWLFGDATE
ncbi:MAG: hypothetical protein ABI045_03950 [Flavobacteriales bacterium]